LGDLNADISDISSLFGQHLTQFSEDNTVILSTKELLPADSYTHVSEAWHTTSWLDHCISTADAHDCIKEAEILYGLATADHIPVSMFINIKGLPELAYSDGHKSGEKLDWTRLTEDDLQ